MSGAMLAAAALCAAALGCAAGARLLSGERGWEWLGMPGNAWEWLENCVDILPIPARSLLPRQPRLCRGEGRDAVATWAGMLGASAGRKVGFGFWRCFPTFPAGFSCPGEMKGKQTQGIL